jgi:hypothetical protein
MEKELTSKPKVKRPYEAIYNRLVYKARKRGLPISITYLDFLELTKVEKCHYCETPIHWTKHNPSKKGTPNRCNLDRKSNDRSIGYTLENVVVCCPQCNFAKGCNFTYEEFMLLVPTLRVITHNRLSSL